MSQHTPGPWTVDGHIVLSGTSPVAHVSNSPITAGGNYNANTRLIAAAPDLLEACKVARDELQRYQLEDAECLTVERTSELIETLHDAILKSRGQ